MAPDQRPALARALDLTPHPEGGWYRRTWTAPVQCRPEGYPGPRASASAIYFLLEPGQITAWHRVRSDELWLWHRGGALHLRLAGSANRPGSAVQTVPLGPQLDDGQAPAALVPAQTWQAACPAHDREVLVTCVVSPGFEFADFTSDHPLE